MAWDTEQTRAKLLAASVAEFSAHGFAGARIERISAAAGVNRERLYSYFGNKRTLFEAVLAARLIATLEGVPVLGTGAEAVGDFAGRYFDACVAEPALARLVVWEGLEFDGAVDADARRVRASTKVAELVAAVPSLSRMAAEDLLLDIVTLCHGWQTTPNLGAVVMGEPDDRRRRAAIVRIASLLVP